MEVVCLEEEDLAELEPAENITDVTFNWERGDGLRWVLLELMR